MKWMVISKYNKYVLEKGRYKINEYGGLYDNKSGKYLNLNDDGTFSSNTISVMYNKRQISMSVINLLNKRFNKSSSNRPKIKDPSLPLHYTNVEDRHVNHSKDKVIRDIIIKNRHNTSTLHLSKIIKKETGIKIHPVTIGKYIKSIFKYSDPFVSEKERKHRVHCAIEYRMNEFVRNKIDSKEFVDKRMVKRIFKNEAKEYIIDKLISKIFEKYRNELDTNNCEILINRNGKNAIYRMEIIENIVVLEDGIYKRDNQKFYNMKKCDPVYIYGSEGYITFGHLYKDTFGEKLN